ncbi:MAG TPA: hypothetical protein VGK67_24660 [Myxococcales bacterium]|jgi:tetratricopeptide (TPR) repeat protein
MRAALPFLALGLFLLAPAPALALQGSTPLETELLADADDRLLTRFDLLDAALVVGGAKDRRTLEEARARLDARLDPVLKAVPRGDRRVMAKLLIQALHTPGGPGKAPLLGKYVAHATTLQDLLDDGSFNCVSATILYLAAAKELSLDARAVLLPSHARAAVVLEGKHVIVETTNRLGFDASAETAREVAARFRPAGEASNSVDLYSDESGTEVDDIALLGVVYTNLAVVAKQRGDLAAAEALDTRADVFVAPSARPLMRLVRASTLGELAILRLNEGRTAEAVDLAFQAAQLVPEGEDARLARHNLKALAQRRLSELLPAGEKEMFAFVERLKPFPDVERDLRSRAWDLAGGLRGKKGDFEGAAAAAREAARVGSGLRSDGVLGHNLAVAELNRLIELGQKDPERAWADYEKLTVPPELETQRRQLGANIAGQRAQKALDRGDCPLVDRRVIDWMVLDPKAPTGALRAACKNEEGLVAWKAKDFASAARSFREAMGLNRDEPAFPKNLAGALGNQVGPLLQARKCKEARPLIDEGLRVAPEDDLFRKAAAFCAR